jgi:hypothetical protein
LGQQLQRNDCKIDYEVVGTPPSAPLRKRVGVGLDAPREERHIAAVRIEIVDRVLDRDSPAVNAGMATFPYVLDDLAGKARTDGKPDIGAIELSPDAAKFGALTEADVGPMAP